MDISVIDAGNLRKTLTVSYSAAELKATETTKTAQFSSQMNLKGFRKGKTPKSLVQKRYGTAITAESADELIQKGISEAMQSESLSPIGPMDEETRTVDSATGITYVTSFDIKPSFDLPDFASFDISTEVEAVAADAVDKEIEGFAQRSGDNVDLAADACLIKDDSVTLSGKITAGDEVIRDIHDLNHLIGGYPLFGKEPEEVITLTEKLSVGDVLEFDCTLPERFTPEEWANKDAHICVTIQSATRSQPATIDDAFAQRMGTEDLDDLRGKVLDGIEQRLGNELQQKQTEEIIDASLAALSFELPETLLKSMIDDNVKAAELAKTRNENAPDIDTDEIAVTSEKALRRHILIDAVITTHNTHAQRADLDNQLSMAAWQSGRKADEIEKELQESGQINQVVHEISENKAIQFMLSAALPIDDDETSADEDEKEVTPKAKKPAAKKTAAKKTAAKKTAAKKKAEDKA